jgi:hypothetical protein
MLHIFNLLYETEQSEHVPSRQAFAPIFIFLRFLAGREACFFVVRKMAFMGTALHLLRRKKIARSVIFRWENNAKRGRYILEKMDNHGA